MSTCSSSFGTVYWWERTFQCFLQDKSAHLKTWHGLQKCGGACQEGSMGEGVFKNSFKVSGDIRQVFNNFEAVMGNDPIFFFRAQSSHHCFCSSNMCNGKSCGDLYKPTNIHKL